MSSNTFINVLDEGVEGDGVTDDAPALNSLFASLSSAGPATVYFPYGVYYIKSPVLLDPSPISGLRVLADPGTIIKAATISAGGVWTTTGASMFQMHRSIVPSTNILIEGFTFEGQAFGTTGNAAMGIYTTAVTGLTVRNCVFQNIGDTSLGGASSPRNDGILLGDAVSGASARAKDVLIEKCRFVNCVRNGISGIDVDGLVVRDCYFNNIDNSGIDCEPNASYQYARNIKIFGCTFEDWYESAIVIIPGAALRGSRYPAQMEGLKIADCYMDGATTSQSGIYVYDWIDVTIVGNTVIRADDPGIYLQSCKGARIIGNHVRDITSSTGAILVSTADSVQPIDHIIQGNTIENSAGYGIRVVDLDSGIVQGNIVRVYDTALAARSGISVLPSASTTRNVAVVGNFVTGGGGTGGVSGGGKPIAIDASATHILVVGNVCQENGAAASTDSIDNNAASTIQMANCDDQRSTFPFTSAGGDTPICGHAVGQSSTARKMSMEVDVAGSAPAGNVDVASDFITLVPVINIIFSPINAAAAAMMLKTGSVYCKRTATGFQLVHNGNDSASTAIFQIQASTS